MYVCIYVYMQYWPSIQGARATNKYHCYTYIQVFAYETVYVWVWSMCVCMHVTIAPDMGIIYTNKLN